jgi:FKBP-type peptidyl-prolyl cis-trans isomerase FkpA
MKKSRMLMGFMLLLCVACSNVKETPKGFKYTVVRRGDGKAVKPGKFLIMSMVFRDGKDSVWNDSRTKDAPMVVMVQDTAAIKMEDGIDEIFRQLTKGDSITFKVGALALFEKTFRQKLPPKIDPKSEFTFNMSVKDVYDSAQVMKLQEEITTKQNEKYLKEQKEQLAKDDAIIDAYLKANKIAAVRDSSGLWYLITKEGKGAKPNPSQTVVVNYVGKLLEGGRIFDQSTSPVTFALGRLIKGWQIGFPLLSVGSKATFFVPSSLGYGRRGFAPNIPENANLIFVVELIGIK